MNSELPTTSFSGPADTHRWQECRGLFFDLDGVITPTLMSHKIAWHNLFSRYFEQRSQELQKPLDPYTTEDYYRYVDGKHRLEGVRAVLASRQLPEADNRDIVECLGTRKNDEFMKTLHREGIRPYPGTVALIEMARLLGIPYAVVSSSRNAREVLQAARLLDKFNIIIDGNTADDHTLASKPAPDMYLYAATVMGVPITQCAIFEDATAGVAAGKAAQCGLVVGVNRGSGVEDLIAAGADIVVNDLAEVLA